MSDEETPEELAEWAEALRMNFMPHYASEKAKAADRAARKKWRILDEDGNDITEETAG
jgi:hypothetical protein